ncbi:MAG: hypothetical protein NTV81_02545, partial [Candidatus Komeilibacteria bacterium]|nr:hypothetical protein [Candidatus Komeilibacteria bacterium]
VLYVVAFGLMGFAFVRQVVNQTHNNHQSFYFHIILACLFGFVNTYLVYLTLLGFCRIIKVLARLRR